MSLASGSPRSSSRKPPFNADMQSAGPNASGHRPHKMLTTNPHRPVLGRNPRPALALAAAGLAGALCGVAAKMADQSQVDWLNDLGTYPAIWMLIVVAISSWSRTPLLAAAHTATFFVVMVGSYYLYAHQVLGFGTVREEMIWSIAAITIAPLTAAALTWASRHNHPASSLIPALIAGIVLASGPLSQYLSHLQHVLPEQTGLHPVQAILDLAVAITTIAVIPQYPATRLLAAGLTIPSTWLAPQLIQLITNLAYK